MNSINITNNYYDNVTINNGPAPQIIVVSELPLTNSTEKALVDERYYEHLRQVSKWYLNKKYHMSTNSFAGKQIYLHSYIMQLEGHDISNWEVDHANRNPLHNWADNLRLSNRQQQLRNKDKQSGCSSHKYKGVSWNKKNLKWRAYMHHNFQQIHLGYYADEEEAARVVDAALRQLPIDERFKVYNFPNF